MTEDIHSRLVRHAGAVCISTAVEREASERIKELQAALSSAQADRKALMKVVRGAMCRRLDGEHTLKTAIIALPPHLMKEAQE